MLKGLCNIKVTGSNRILVWMHCKAETQNCKYIGYMNVCQCKLVRWGVTNCIVILRKVIHQYFQCHLNVPRLVQETWHLCFWEAMEVFEPVTWAVNAMWLTQEGAMGKWHLNNAMLLKAQREERAQISGTLFLMCIIILLLSSGTVLLYFTLVIFYFLLLNEYVSLLFWFIALIIAIKSTRTNPDLH